MTDPYIVLKGDHPAGLDKEQFQHEILIGLTAPQKVISSKYFYDAKGDKLFQAITHMPEYYLTDCEAEILGRYGSDILKHIGQNKINLVELGAGDGRKTKILIDALRKSQQDFCYIPIDISRHAIDGLCRSMLDSYPDIDIKGLVSEYFDGIRWIDRAIQGQNFVLFLGSNLGNFSAPLAHEFLTRLWLSMNPGDHLFIGLDLRKDIQLLFPAYSDPHGYTREFNLNLLRRINQELDADFDVDQFEHVARYNAELNAMESAIVSKCEQVVRLGTLRRNIHFRAGESVHTEYSYKYAIDQIDAMAKQTGFEVAGKFFDEKNYFCDSIWRVIKE